MQTCTLFLCPKDHRMAHRVAIALGSNVRELSQRLFFLESALSALRRDVGPITATSGLFETPTAYVENAAPPSTTAVSQSELSEAIPPHLNAVVVIDSMLPSPDTLMMALLNIEKQLGRKRDDLAYSAILGKPLQKIRPLDLDVLLFDEMMVSTDVVTIPHPRMTERNFVLFPLADAAPNMKIVLSKTASQTARECILKNLVASLTAAPDKHALYSIPLRVYAVRPDTLWPFGPGQVPRVMGILNVTPDSFSDGGLFLDVDNACQHARDMIAAGADIIDVGGESTAPGSDDVPLDVELERILPVIKSIRAISPTIPISVDTRKSEVLRQAVAAGADVLNDVSGGCSDPNMLTTAAMLGVSVILGHMRESPATMMRKADYSDVVHEVVVELSACIEKAIAAGIPRWRIMADVGLGFSKTAHHNYALLRHLDTVANHLPHGVAQCIGLSRKRFLGAIVNRVQPLAKDGCGAYGSLGLTADEVACRDVTGTALTCCICYKQLEELHRYPPEWHADHVGSCIAVVRTHAVRDVKLAMESLKSYVVPDT